MKKEKINAGLQKKIKELERVVREQRQLIEHLDKVNQMHVQAEELSRQERLSADQVLRAQERVQELATRERMEADRLISAQEELHAFTEEERKEAAELNRALIGVQELSDKERIESDGLVGVHLRLEEMSIEEIRQRDAILESILDISKQINKLLPERELFLLILNSAMDRLQATAGVVIMDEQDSPRIRVSSGFPVGLSDAEIIARARDCQNERQGGPGVARGSARVRIVSVLSRESRPVGMVYLEKDRADGAFRAIDQEFLDLFASNASMACNNAFLFNKAQSQNKELKRALMIKNNFIDHLSGDLRKPLARLEKHLEALPTGRKRDEALDIVAWVMRALDKVLSVAALNKESEEMFSHTISIEDLVRDIFAALAPEIKRLALRMEVLTEGKVPRLEGNRDIFNTILDEVICNAVVYNKRGGRVSVLISSQDQRLRIVVSDSGIGIRNNEIKKVFNRFYRSATSYDYYSKGAGLGLFIVRSFVENYGGTLSLSSKEGEGTIITIEIPH